MVIREYFIILEKVFSETINKNKTTYIGDKKYAFNTTLKSKTCFF